MWYVYLITNKVNGKRYVGKADDIAKRWLSHVRGSNGDTLVTRAIRKYGKEQFEVTMLGAPYEQESASLEAEVRWIAELRTNVVRHGVDAGYNQTDGGEGSSGYRWSEEQKQRQRERLKGQGRRRTLTHRQALSRSMMGKNVGYKPTAEMLLKISVAVTANHPYRGKVGPRKGMQNSPLHRARLSQSALKITPEQTQQCEVLLRSGISIAQTVRNVVGVTRAMVKRIKSRMS